MLDWRFVVNLPRFTVGLVLVFWIRHPNLINPLKITFFRVYPNPLLAREKILTEIANKENEFLASLMDNKRPYIAAMGPNIHIRDNWENYYASHKPMAIFLKSKPELVFKGLVRREEELKEYQSKKGFASWNQGVTREYNDRTQSYESLPGFLALNKIKELIKKNEDAYERIADYTFDSTELFEWHDNFNEKTKEHLINLIDENAG